MNTNNLDRLQKAKKNQDRAIRLIVLEMAYLSGLTATNPIGNELDEDTEAVMTAPPAEI